MPSTRYAMKSGSRFGARHWQRKKWRMDTDRASWLSSPAGRVVPLVLIGVIWQAASTLRLVDPSFLPSPARIGIAAWDLLAGREIRDNLFITLWRASLGLGLGSIAGIWLGLM